MSQSTFPNTFYHLILLISPGDTRVVLLLVHWSQLRQAAWGRVDRGCALKSFQPQFPDSLAPPLLSCLRLSGRLVLLRNILIKWKHKLCLDQTSEGRPVPGEAGWPGHLHIPPVPPIPIPPPAPPGGSMEHSWVPTASPHVCYLPRGTKWVCSPWKDWVVIGEISMERPEIPGHRKRTEEKASFFFSWV